jgi:hypothetical protein
VREWVGVTTNHYGLATITYLVNTSPLDIATTLTQTHLRNRSITQSTNETENSEE